MKIQGIYAIIHTKSGRTYIGSSRNISKRLGTHKTQLKYNKHSNPILQNYYNKYGLEEFEFKIILEISDITQLLLIENEYISKYVAGSEDSFNTQEAGKTGCVDPMKYKSGPEHHLYGSVGPNAGKIFSSEIRTNMSIGQRGKKYIDRKPQPAEARARMAETKKNVPWSDARRKAYEARFK